jgi:hypothetical protein
VKGKGGKSSSPWWLRWRWGRQRRRQHLHRHNIMETFVYGRRHQGGDDVAAME